MPSAQAVARPAERRGNSRAQPRTRSSATTAVRRSAGRRSRAGASVAAAIPSMPASASSVSPRLPLTASSRLRLLARVFGVRRNSASLAKSACTDARAVTSDVDCQMMKRAERVPPGGAGAAVAAARPPGRCPMATSSGIAATRNRGELCGTAGRRRRDVDRAAEQEEEEAAARAESPYHCSAPEK